MYTQNQGNFQLKNDEIFAMYEFISSDVYITG